MSGQEQLAGVKAGDVLAGKYRVDRVLGVGGMGVVVAAHHLQLDDRVAIKFLLAETLASQEAVARFAREARAAVKIKSEHVARVTDVGTLENGAPYMVMEYLEGEDLSARLAREGPLPIEQTVDLVLQASEAIAEAHALGIVHRDLKPANLFLAQLPGGVQSVKVLDFGISKVTGGPGSGSSSSVTKTSALMGSPLYMSPEQMQSSKNVDARGDIWALGVILYELLAGASPFTGDTMPELILSIMSAAPGPLRNRRPEVAPGLEAVILRCLDKDRGKRFQTVAELAVALVPFGSRRARHSADRISQVMQKAGMGASALALPPSSGDAAPASAQSTVGAFGATKPGGGRSRSVALMLGTAALVLGIGAVALSYRSPGEEPAPSAARPAEPPTVAELSPLPAAAPVPEPEPAPSAVPSAPPPEARPVAVQAEPAKPRPPAGTRPPKPPAKPPATAATAPPAKLPLVPASSQPRAPSLIDDRR